MTNQGTVFADPVAEKRLLAACIDNPEMTLRLRELLFTGDRIQIFHGMRKCFIQYGEITYEGIQLIMGRALPAEYEAARGARPDAIIDVLVNIARRRELANVSDRLNVAMSRPIIDQEEVTKALEIPAITSEADTTLQSGAVEFVSDFTRKQSGQYQFVDTGLPFLNDMLGGEWPRQGLTVILGGGGAGKTALIGNSMLNMGLMGLGSLMISLEMTKPRLVGRLVANLADIDGNDIRIGKIRENEIPRFNEALDVITNKLPIWIDDRPGTPINGIIDQIRAHKERYNIQAVFVDYLQIIGGESDDTSNLYAKFAQELRNAAYRYDLSMVVLAQQNRGFTGLQSILGSGRVGHIADVTLELKRAEGANPNAAIIPVEVDIHKNRDGPLGSQTVPYATKYLRFG